MIFEVLKQLTQLDKEASLLWVSEKLYSISDSFSVLDKENSHNRVAEGLIKELHIMAAQEGLLLTDIEDMVPTLVNEWLENPETMTQYSVMQSRMDVFESKLSELYDMQSRIMLAVNNLLVTNEGTKEK